jgi:hypothetical protein
MKPNLLRWQDLDSVELRILLNERFGGPGQYNDRTHNPNTLYLPLAGSSCRIVLTFRDEKVVDIKPGPALDGAEWEQFSEQIGTSIRVGPLKVGRDYSFSSYRVDGWWRGKLSGVQILPAPHDAPRAHVEMAAHPFILEFPIKESDLWPITNHRRMQKHRKLTCLLNVLLAGRTSQIPRRSEHFWADVATAGDSEPNIRWVQEFFFAKLGAAIVDGPSPPQSQQLKEIDPDEYYVTMGHDGRGLNVPADLDQLIDCYTTLSEVNQRRCDRATFWFDMASRQWNISVSASFAALVSAIESLTERGAVHGFTCPICGGTCRHEVPGATERFRDFFEKYAAAAALRKRRTEMYSLRSGILHGSTLMQLDQDLAFGWDPHWWNQSELHEELWGLTRVALRNWIKKPPAN